MLSDEVFISAEHLKPATGSSVTFYESNDPDGASSTRSVTSNTQQIGTSDLYVGTLDSPLSSGFTFYDFATEDITDLNPGPNDDFSNSPYYEENAYVFGKSPTTTWDVSQDLAVGRNKLDRFWVGQDLTDQNANEGDAIGANDDTDTTDAVTFEAMLEGKDSGGPLFVDNEGVLTLVGINWFRDNENNDFFGSTYLGNYDEEVQNFIDAVPEPQTYALFLGLASALLLFVRRRRQA